MKNDTIIKNIPLGGGQKSLLMKFDNYFLIGIKDPFKKCQNIVEIDEDGNILHSINFAKESYLLKVKEKENIFYSLLYDTKGFGSTIKTFNLEKNAINTLIREDSANIRSFDVSNSSIRYIRRKDKRGEIVEPRNKELRIIPFPYKYVDYSEFYNEDVVSYRNEGENGTFFFFDTEKGEGVEVSHDGNIKAINITDNDIYLLTNKKNIISVNFIDSKLNIVEVFNYKSQSGNDLLGESLKIFNDEIVVVFSERKSKTVFENKILKYNITNKKISIIEINYIMPENTYLIEKKDNQLLLWIIEGQSLIKSKL